MSNRLIKSFGYAIEGIGTLFKETPNARIHFILAILAIFLGFFLKISSLEWMVLFLSIGFVVCAEGFNTAIETITDLASPDIHPLAKKTKDIAAGAVLIAALTSIAIGILIFAPKIINLFSAF